MPPIFTQHPLESLLVVSAIIFCCGIFTIISRRNAVSILMGVELVLNAANLNFIAFAQFSGRHINGPDDAGWYLSTAPDTEFILKDGVKTASIRFVQDIDVRDPEDTKFERGSRRRDAPSAAQMAEFEVYGKDAQRIAGEISASHAGLADAASKAQDGDLKTFWISNTSEWKNPSQYSGPKELILTWAEPREVGRVRARFASGTFVEKFKIQYLDEAGWKDVPVARVSDESGVHGFSFVLFVILLAAAEAAVALAIIIGIYQNFGKIDVDKATMLKE